MNSVIEVYIHIMRIDDLIKGKPVNVKVNYADQYDMRMLINPKKYIITRSKDRPNMITIKKKSILDYLSFKKTIK